MLGFAPSLDLMLRYRVLLAPLRYGAGLKGKVRLLVGQVATAPVGQVATAPVGKWRSCARQRRTGCSLFLQKAPPSPLCTPSLQVVDAWWHGLPVVTTPVGAEGMHAADAAPQDLAAAGLSPPAAAAAPPDPAANGYVWQLGGAEQQAAAGADTSSEEWGGLCGAASADGIVAAAALLYSEPRAWEAAQASGFRLLSLLYDRERNLGRVLGAVEAARRGLERRRAADFTGAMLWQTQLRATEYFSRWIELKEGLKAANSDRANRASQ